MRGTKRLAVSDSNNEKINSDNKRIMEGSPFDMLRAEPCQEQPVAATSLDMKRAESSQQHVRALNTQFASWVQEQLKNHPDELWEDGAHDYLAHASSIKVKFSDIINWLTANAGRESLPSVGSFATENQSVPKNNSGLKLFQAKTGFTTGVSTSSFAPSWSSAAGSHTTENKSVPDAKNSESKLFPGVTPASTNMSFGTSWSSKAGSHTNENKLSETKRNGTELLQGKSGFNPVSSTTTFSAPWSSTSGSHTTDTMLVSETKSNENKLFQGNTVFSSMGTTTSFATPWNPGPVTNSQNAFMSGSQSSASTKLDASNDADGDEEVPQPSSPSVKKSEEQGVVVVHEVKCKLYVKSTNPAEKDAWKDKGTGQLSIKCKEGVSKGTKESKPTIVIRNDVGRLLLNALLYPGIKTNAQKNSLVAIFHTSDDNNNNSTVVARTFLIRTKSEEDRNKLAAAIQEYAPSL